MRYREITSVDPDSPARDWGIQAGWQLVSVNGHPIADVLDYRFYTYDAVLRLRFLLPDGGDRLIEGEKEEGEPLGLNFASFLMDKPRHCGNHCLFCFVDQMPPGMRETLYFKDDDARLSFLMGNYITLTNLSPREVSRILRLHISPINVSVHAMDPDLRSRLLGTPRGGAGVETLRTLAAGGVTLNCQIVLCPGLNDGAQLQYSMEQLAALHPAVNSVSIVPVGITRHRQGLYPLTPFSPQGARETLAQVETYAAHCRETLGTSLFWCADELYLKAGRPLPEDDYYEDYTQLENGVGMLRLLRTECLAACHGAPEGQNIPPFSLATGVAAAPFLREMIDTAAARCHTTLEYTVYPIVNHFFGETIDVAGLVTGGDLLAQLRGKPLGERLLIPRNMLRHGETVFLDDVSLETVRQTLAVPVCPVEQDGFQLFDTIFGT